MKTSDVKALVREVLDSLPQPYTEHVIDDVFAAIEREPQWIQEYGALCISLGKTVVNNWGGYWTATLLGKSGERQVPSKKSQLIGSYSILDTDAKTVLRKPTEEEARELLAEYYQAHREELPKNIRQYREQIIDLLEEGVPPKVAFAMVTRAGENASDGFGSR